MIITDIQTSVVGNPWKNWVFVAVHTDEGVTGLGEATGGLSTKPHEAQVRELKPIVMGQDPRNVRGLWDHMFKSVYLNSYPAMAGVEMACWDISAKVLGVPVWRLLGGKSRPRIRAYANGWYTGPRDPHGFAEAAKAVSDRGYTALKFDPFGSAYAHLTRSELREALALVGAVREAVARLCGPAHRGTRPVFCANCDPSGSCPATLRTDVARGSRDLHGSRCFK